MKKIWILADRTNHLWFRRTASSTRREFAAWRRDSRLFFTRQYSVENCLSKNQRTANSLQFRINNANRESQISLRVRRKVPEAVLDFLVTFWSSKK